LLEYTSGLG